MPETETCRRFRAAVELLADGEPMPGAAELQRHADACTACREELERARELARELRRLPAEICPPRVTAAVLARAAAAARPVPARPVPAPTPAPPAPAAAAGGAASLAGPAGRRPWRHRRPSSPAPCSSSDPNRGRPRR